MTIPPAGGATPRGRVLCVDDNPDIADTEALLLGLVGFDARPCYGGRDALALAETFRPTVCLLDMNMPGMNGDELAARLRERAAGTPLLLIAVTATTADARGTAWFDVHLFKPVEAERLLAAVASPDRGRADRGGWAAGPSPAGRPTSGPAPKIAT